MKMQNDKLSLISCIGPVLLYVIFSWLVLYLKYLPVFDSWKANTFN